MDGYRFRCLTLIAVALSLGTPQVGWPQPSVAKTSATASQNDKICKFYSLADFADNEKLCRWIVKTIPDVVQPQTWNAVPQQEFGTIRYNVDAGIMVIRQSPAVHAEVEAFLQNLRKTMAKKDAATKVPNAEIEQAIEYQKERELILKKLAVDWQKVLQSQSAFPPEGVLKVEKTLIEIKRRLEECRAEIEKNERKLSGFNDPNVLPASFSAPKAFEPEAAIKPNGYPIPTAAKQPKHLFHMILRFEGTDMGSAVADLAKKLNPEAAADGAKNEPAKGDAMSQLFHFIIRYEGEGLIDENVVDFMRALQKTMSEANDPPAAKKAVPETPPAYSGPPTAPTPAAPTVPEPLSSGYSKLAPVKEPQLPSPPTASPFLSLPYFIEVLEQIRLGQERKNDLPLWPR